jgi:hypothetical protein
MPHKLQLVTSGTSTHLERASVGIYANCYNINI